MIHFTGYAEEKFSILNSHGVFVRKEQVIAALEIPDRKNRLGNYAAAEKDGLKVVYQKEADIKKVITFYPI